MSSKEAKPTLAGVNVKTRKRNVVVPHDPESFADAVVQLVQDSYDEGSSLADKLEAAAKALDAAEIEYSRYGDTLFEVWFCGGRLATGASLAEGGARLPINILAAEATRDAIAPYIKVFQSLTRRRPFLVRGLENTLVKLLLSLEFFDELGRKKIAIAFALTLSLKIAVVPENVFAAMLTDRLVTKGTVLEVLTILLQEFLSKDSLDDLVTILTKAKMVDRLLDFLPPTKRTKTDFDEHFKAAGLGAFVDWNTRRQADVKTSELLQALTEAITNDPAATPAEALALVKQKKNESNLPESDVLRVIWSAVMSSVNMTGKNQQQILQAILHKIKTYHKVMAAFANSGKAELALLVAVQVQCYEDNRLLKIFSDIIRFLYEADIVGEDTVMQWYKKGSHPKGRNVFLKDIEPFIKWLEEAEEEEEDD